MGMSGWEIRKKGSAELFQIFDNVVRKGACVLLNSRGERLATSRPKVEKEEPFRPNMQAVNFRIVSNHALIISINEARAVDIILRLIRAQSRVVRREARTRSCGRVRWC